MTRDEHLMFCKNILDAVRFASEEAGIHPNEKGQAVEAIVSACARSALSCARAADSKVLGVAAYFDDDGRTMHVVIHNGVDTLDVTPWTHPPESA